MGFRALPEVHHGCHVYDDAEIHSIYTYQDSELLAPAVCFAYLVGRATWIVVYLISAPEQTGRIQMCHR